MNRRALVSVLVSFALVASTARAQQVDRADEVAQAVHDFYAQMRTMEMRFDQHYWHRVYDRTDTSRGDLRIDRVGHRVRFDYAHPATQVIVADGREWTHYQADTDGGPGQYLHGTGDVATSAGGLAFLVGTASLMTDFTRRLLPRPRGEPAHIDVLELRPIRPSAQYVRIRLYVDNRPRARGGLHRVSIETPDGDWNRFVLSDPHFNRELAPDVFRYTPPSGARDISASTPD